MYIYNSNMKMSTRVYLILQQHYVTFKGTDTGWMAQAQLQPKASVYDDSGMKHNNSTLPLPQNVTKRFLK